MTRYPLAGDLQAGLASRAVGNPSHDDAVRYIAIDSEGNIVGVEHTQTEAIGLLRSSGAKIAVDDTQPASELGGNPLPYHHGPPGKPGRLSQVQAGLPTVELDEVMGMEVGEAYRALHRYFATLKNKQGQPVKAYTTPQGMLKQFFGQNMKLSKAHPTERTHIRGLTLFPADKIRQYSMFDAGSPVDRLIHELGWQTYDPMTTRSGPAWTTDFGEMRTFCVGSSEQCRNSCLVYTARNVADVYNHRRKVVASIALLQDPVAFCRMLVAAIEGHVKNSEAADIKPFVRLNVLSDIAWEVVFPELFPYFEKTSLTFYDYTKVHGRNVPGNYDLTFSYSGENEKLCHEEIAFGRRVAVVFVGMKSAGGEWKRFKMGARLPKTHWGMPVVDGDISDVRPLDPSPCVVGLRWKTPGGQDIDPTTEAFSFVTRAYHKKGGEVGTTSNPSVEYLIAPVTPRFQPINEEQDDEE